MFFKSVNMLNKIAVISFDHWNYDAHIVSALQKKGIEVETLPGATAVIPALVNSGFPIDRFVFEGFLPHKKGRQTRWKAIAEEERTTVFNLKNTMSAPFFISEQPSQRLAH